MPTEYCPKCKAIKNTTVSTTLKTKKDKKGKEILIQIHSYFCETCNSFIKSTESPISK